MTTLIKRSECMECEGVGIHERPSETWGFDTRACTCLPDDIVDRIVQAEADKAELVAALTDLVEKFSFVEGGELLVDRATKTVHLPLDDIRVLHPARALIAKHGGRHG